MCRLPLQFAAYLVIEDTVQSRYASEPEQHVSTLGTNPLPPFEKVGPLPFNSPSYILYYFRYGYIVIGELRA